MKLLIVSLSVIFLASCVPFKNVKLKKPKEATYKQSQVEPSIAIDPSNPNRVIAGTVLSDFYYSMNGGKSWRTHTLKSKYGVWGDPVLMFDTTGSAYYFHLSSYKETSHLDRIVCQKPIFGKIDGKWEVEYSHGTFPKPNGTKVQDKHWTVVDPSTNAIYITWTQFDAYNSSDSLDSSIIVFSKSLDRGETWSDPKRISKFAGDCLDNDNTVEGAVPAVGPNGEVYVTWTGPKGLVLQKSFDQGETWLEEELLIEEHHGGWVIDIPGLNRANGLPILKCDLSGGNDHGTLYLNWCDQRNGSDDTDVWLMKSTDGGENWSEAVRVNQDDSKKHQFFTWFTIDQSTGFLYFVYYDRRNYDDIKTDVYVSTSRDGGKTFVDTKISGKPFAPNPALFFGDYLNIDAVNGQIRPIWPRMDKGKISLYVTLMSEEGLQELLD
jgi:hypothetical protein